MTPPTIIYGTAGLNPAYGISTAAGATELLETVRTLGIKDINTAQGYGPSEKLLGEANAAVKFNISTKHPGGAYPSPSTKEVVTKSCNDSLQALNTKQVDTYLLHAPDLRCSLEETLSGINALYEAKAFQRFGISNHTAAQVEDVMRVAKQNGWVTPTVFEGSYSAVARRPETELFPVLRRHGITFQAYSPIAGGFLAKTPAQLAGARGRWDAESQLGKMYRSLYDNPAQLEALQTWNGIATDAGVSPVEMAYRWIAHSSFLDGDAGDGIIIGANSAERAALTVGFIDKGPLEKYVVDRIDAIWPTIADVSPLDNWNDYLSRA